MYERRLPSPAKQQVYRRLFEVLTERDQSGEYAAISSFDRAAIREILIDTKPELQIEFAKLEQSL
jgi:hypothetical protein